jgi:hypothetical protein
MSMKEALEHVRDKSGVIEDIYSVGPLVPEGVPLLFIRLKRRVSLEHASPVAFFLTLEMAREGLAVQYYIVPFATFEAAEREGDEQVRFPVLSERTDWAAFDSGRILPLGRYDLTRKVLRGAVSKLEQVA